VKTGKKVKNKNKIKLLKETNNKLISTGLRRIKFDLLKGIKNG
jgi:hypothetical protein